jgi:hypothetical protein
MDGRIEAIVGHFDPVMFRPSDVTIVAECQEVVGIVGGIQVEPKSLRDKMVGEQIGGCTTIGATSIADDDRGSDVLPSSSFVGPSSSAPSGVSVAAQSLLIIDAHAGSGAVDGIRLATGDGAAEFDAASYANEVVSGSLEPHTASSLEENGLDGSRATTATELDSSRSGLELDAAVFARFGKHEHIVRSLVTKNKISVCKNCRRPRRPSWISDGLGTALKPAVEMIVVARKPLAESSVAANVMAWGTGGLNVDASRVRLNGEQPPTGSGDRRNGDIYAQDEWTRTQMANGGNVTPSAGRFPPNLLMCHHPECMPCGERRVKTQWSQATQHGEFKGWQKNQNGEVKPVGYADPDGLETVAEWRCVEQCPIRLLDEQSGERKSGGVTHQPKHSGYGFRPDRDSGISVYREPDTGTASRFFPQFSWTESDFVPFLYQPKASRRERGESNTHPTVKPLNLLKWLCKLITPPGGTILDPFAGSFTTGIAAEAEGFSAILMESDPDYFAIGQGRLAAVRAQTPLLDAVGRHP